MDWGAGGGGLRSPAAALKIRMNTASKCRKNLNQERTLLSAPKMYFRPWANRRGCGFHKGWLGTVYYNRCPAPCPCMTCFLAEVSNEEHRKGVQFCGRELNVCPTADGSTHNALGSALQNFTVFPDVLPMP